MILEELYPRKDIAVNVTLSYYFLPLNFYLYLLCLTNLLCAAKEKGRCDIQPFRHSHFNTNKQMKYVLIRFSVLILPRDLKNDFSVS